APSTYYFLSHRGRLDLHSFPTRRSSDLLPLLPPLGLSAHSSGSSDSSSGLPNWLRSTCPRTSLSRRRRRISSSRRRACASSRARSEEHTAELQSRGQRVCRFLLARKNRG